MFSLAAHFFHKFGAFDALVEAGEVFDDRGVHEEATGGETFKDDGFQFCAGSVDGGGVAGWAGANDDNVGDSVGGVLSHGCPSVRSMCCSHFSETDTPAHLFPPGYRGKPPGGEPLMEKDDR